ncbi:arylesterase [Limimaricola cinnabarinus]|uniref:Arylesterase n=1 Tax=Limimaricola cinnabarinus LL-001 TaxID=1337093 RepID=U3ADA0_9RHOB|nr:arylesterase [Limimaricola cinnabarinus]GAD55654.1 arylesterase precursor [Limimaricola cinnabarinus LL-001]
MRNPLLPLLFAAAALAAPVAAQTEEVVIAALGDSLTAGYGLPQGEGLVPQLQEWLDAEGAQIRLINAGVSGDTSAGGLARTDWTLTPEVDAMIVALGGNDFLRGLAPEALRDNLDGILDKADAAGVEALLVGIAAGPNYGADYAQAFDGAYETLAETHDVPLYPDFFSALQDGQGVDAARRAYLQSDGIHPNAEGVAVIVEALGPWVLDLAEEVRADALRGDGSQAAAR